MLPVLIQNVKIQFIFVIYSATVVSRNSCTLRLAYAAASASKINVPFPIGALGPTGLLVEPPAFGLLPPFGCGWAIISRGAVTINVAMSNILRLRFIYFVVKFV